MAETIRLYDADPRCFSFTARVLACREAKNGFEVTLDRSAFFPESGGQPGDRGTIGGVPVLDTKERDGTVVHLCALAPETGTEVVCELDRELRFARMQVHSGEHVVSGTAHRLFGSENVGFHMTEDGAVLDLFPELSPEELARLEDEANRAVWDDRPIRAFYPDAETLAKLSFRQKKELAGPVRLVEIEGVDLCACCAPHVSRTGEIGLIRFADVLRHRGGSRITMQAGTSALRSAREAWNAVGEISRLFSVPPAKAADAAKRAAEEIARLEADRADRERRYIRLLAERTEKAGDAPFFFFPRSEPLSPAGRRELADALADRCAGVCGVFAETEDGAWNYVLASRDTDLRAASPAWNRALSGRGGGSKEMIQGSFRAARAEIEEVFYGG